MAESGEHRPADIPPDTIDPTAMALQANAMRTDQTYLQTYTRRLNRDRAVLDDQLDKTIGTVAALAGKVARVGYWSVEGGWRFSEKDPFYHLINRRLYPDYYRILDKSLVDTVSVAFVQPHIYPEPVNGMPGFVLPYDNLYFFPDEEDLAREQRKHLRQFPDALILNQMQAVRSR